MVFYIVRIEQHFTLGENTVFFTGFLKGKEVPPVACGIVPARMMDSCTDGVPNLADSSATACMPSLHCHHWQGSLHKEHRMVQLGVHIYC